MAIDYNVLFNYYSPCTGGSDFCSGRVYVNWFNRDNEAIDFAAAPKVFDTYTATDARFRKFLTTHAERTHYHYGMVNCSELDIPDCPIGEDYTIEYWCEAILNSPNRAIDKLVKIERIIYAADRVHESRLDVSREAAIAQLAGLAVFTQSKASSDSTSGSWGEYLADPDTFGADTITNIFSGFSGSNVGTCLQSICNRLGNWPDVMAGVNWVVHSGISFDTVLSVINLSVFLEKDGDLQLDPLTFQATLIDSDGNVIFNVVGDSSDLQPGYGVFFKSISGISLVPDECYFMVVTVNDVDDNPHISGVSPVAWD